MLADKKKSKKKRSASTPQTSSLSKEQTYIESIDLFDWWDDFMYATNKNGSIKYPTVWSFIQKKTKIDWQRRMLYWMLGPKVDNKDIAASPYKDYPQYDWYEKRERGYWFGSQNVEDLRKDFANQMSALDKVANLGDVNIDIIGQLRELGKQIQREFGGRLFLPDASIKENMMRANLYMNLQKQFMTMMEQAQKMYSRTQGVDLDGINQFLAMMAAGAGQAAGSIGMNRLLGDAGGKTIDADTLQASETVKQLLQMTMKKSVELNVPLPDPDMEKIIVANSSKKKTSVQ